MSRTTPCASGPRQVHQPGGPAAARGQPGAALRIMGTVAVTERVPDLSLFPPSTAVAGDDLRLGGCSLREIAERFGTPAYVVDEQALRSRARDYLAAFTRRHARSRLCFAVKAYPSMSVISLLAAEGLGFDVVGAGELRLALAAGADPATIVMHGNAKTDDDIQA